eukprot:scaffold18.g2041.t1
MATGRSSAHPATTRAGGRPTRRYGAGVTTGQLGGGTSDKSSASPVKVTDPPESSWQGWKEVSTGAQHACAVAVNEEAGYCWGAADFIGPSLTSKAGALATPDQLTVQQGVHWVHLQAGDDGTCGISEEGTLICGALSRATFASQLFSFVSVGGSQTCAIVWPANQPADKAYSSPSGPAFCWNKGSSASSIAAVPGNDDWSLISSGGRAHACGIKSKDNSAWCWGSSNTAGQCPAFSTIQTGKVFNQAEDCSVITTGSPTFKLSGLTKLVDCCSACGATDGCTALNFCGTDTGSGGCRLPGSGTGRAKAGDCFLYTTDPRFWATQVCPIDGWITGLI